MKIQYGITGNYYATSSNKKELINLCQEIGKSSNSIFWHKKHKVWVFRVKNKTHKNRLKNENN